MLPHLAGWVIAKGETTANMHDFSTFNVVDSSPSPPCLVFHHHWWFSTDVPGPRLHAWRWWRERELEVWISCLFKLSHILLAYSPFWFAPNPTPPCRNSHYNIINANQGNLCNKQTQKLSKTINICWSVPTFRDVLVYQMETHLRDEDIQMLGERLPPRWAFVSMTNCITCL